MLGSDAFCWLHFEYSYHQICSVLGNIWYTEKYWKYCLVCNTGICSHSRSFLQEVSNSSSENKRLLSLSVVYGCVNTRACCGQFVISVINSKMFSKGLSGFAHLCAHGDRYVYRSSTQEVIFIFFAPRIVNVFQNEGYYTIWLYGILCNIQHWIEPLQIY